MTNQGSVQLLIISALLLCVTIGIEADSRVNRLGLWREDSPLAPWVFRQLMRNAWN